MDLLKGVTGRIVGGLVSMVVVIAAISWWRADPATRDAVVSGAGSVAAATGRVLGWLAVVAVIPWASFFLIGRVARLESNAAGAALVLAYTAAEAAVLAWLFDWSIRGATAWVFFAAAVLVAAVYNLFACDWIAEKVA